MKVVASCLDFQKILWDFPIFSPQLSNWPPENRWPKTTLELVPLLAIWPYSAWGWVLWPGYQDFWSHPYWIDSFRSTVFKGLLLLDWFTKDSDFPIVFLIFVVPRGDVISVERCEETVRGAFFGSSGIMMIHQIWCSDEADQEFTSQSQIRRPRYLMGIQEDTTSPMRGGHQLRTPTGCWEHSGGQGPGLSSPSWMGLVELILKKL